MAKGRVYELVDLEGCRVVHVPLSAWPAFTGIITDNQYQFKPDCYTMLIERVINMPCQALPESFAFATYAEWESAGNVVINSPETPAGVSRRITHVHAAHVSAGTATFRVSAVSLDGNVTVLYATGVVTIVPATGLTDIFLSEGNYLQLVGTVTATTGTLYFRFWGEEWTL